MLILFSAMNMAMRRDNVSLLIPSSNKIKESQKMKDRGAVKYSISIV